MSGRCGHSGPGNHSEAARVFGAADAFPAARRAWCATRSTKTGYQTALAELRKALDVE